MAENTRLKDLKLQPFRQNSVQLRKNLKLSSKYFGPYTILEKVGQVAYKLDLPVGSNIHPVFHVSLLKKKVSPNHVPSPDLPLTDSEGSFFINPVSILDRREVHRGGTTVEQILVQWAGGDPSQATWEDVKYLKKKFPSFDPWGQGSQNGGGIVMNRLDWEEEIVAGEKTGTDLENGADFGQG